MKTFPIILAKRFGQIVGFPAKVKAINRTVKTPMLPLRDIPIRVLGPSIIINGVLPASVQNL